MSRSDKPFDEALWEASDGPALIADLQDKMTEFRLLQAEILDVVADLDRHGIAALGGYRNTRELLIDTVRVAPSQASKMVSRAQAISETLTPTGHVTPAPLPTVRTALHDGLIDGEHIDIITTTLKRLPDTVEPGVRELVETTLGETARSENPNTVLEHGVQFLRHLDPDGTQPKDAVEPSNTFVFTRILNGSMRFRGQLEPATAELLQQLLDKDATPTKLDDRSPDERYGDALAELVHRAADPQGGAKTRIHVLMDQDWLLQGIGMAELESGCPLAPQKLRELACDADFIPMVLKGQSVPLDVGRSRRLVKESQRAALVARDRGCAYPGCCNPARWADAHHVKHWLDGGETNIDNLVLLCRKHHRVLHASAWQVRIAQDRLPEFIPPKWIDPQQLPRRNTIHHMRP
jgi:hypothetical protein